MQGGCVRGKMEQGELQSHKGERREQRGEQGKRDVLTKYV
jgi:hypothetical protein